jgi:hypothetical protein
MTSTNFELAPPARTVDGLLAVPIDIQAIRAGLVFDGATASASGDATLDFVVGPTGGCPIFDLRQTVTGAWLDGAPLAPGQVAHHDLGGGSGAELRVVAAALAAGSSHTLRLTYTLGPPQAPPAGRYRPALTWSAGPRLRLSFGFTDLGPGRYLESWLPANLIFDQFALELELRILNTAIAHVPITNGAVSPLGPNHWSLAFPARFTALSHLLELRAADTVASLTGGVTLPVSGTALAIEAWKPAGSALDLVAQVASLGSWLAANEASSGPYLHGSRFVAFLDGGGMEYEGGTTSAPGALRHEAFHSWWGRGVKPAAQTDGWWDEAWTVYNDLGGTGSRPFDFTEPPVELSSRNPWVRATPADAYTGGERLFAGAAALVGAAGLHAHMRAFYAERSERPQTTAGLEAFLVARSGAAELVDAFHRFVYGFDDPAPAPDLWLRDDPADSGGNVRAGSFWDSPDLWVRNADDGGTAHQPVRQGHDNWFHARVRNRSAAAVARHFLVTFNVKPFTGLEFAYPADFLPCVAAAAGFDLGPGESAVVKARWPAALVPPAGTHACWLAAVLTRGDRPGTGLNVWKHNNLAQKNLTVADVAPGSWLVLPFVAGRRGLRRARRVSLELVRPRERPRLEAALLHPAPELLEAGHPAAADRSGAAGFRISARPAAPPLDCGGARGGRLGEAAGDLPALAFRAGRTAAIPLRLPGVGQLVPALALRAPEDASPGEVVRVDLLQRDERTRRVTGGLAVELRVR